MRNAIILRYCDIHLKGKNRGFFEKLLKENVKKSLKGIKHTFNVMHSRYLIEDFDDCDYGLITSKIEKIAGIHTYSRCLVVNNDINEIIEASIQMCADKSGTFKEICINFSVFCIMCISEIFNICMVLRWWSSG